MIENLIIYALIACVLFVIFYREDKNEVMDMVHSNYAEYRMELLRGIEDEQRI